MNNISIDKFNIIKQNIIIKQIQQYISNKKTAYFIIISKFIKDFQSKFVKKTNIDNITVYICLSPIISTFHKNCFYNLLILIAIFFYSIINNMIN